MTERKTEFDFLMAIAIATTNFLEDLQENAEGVPQDKLQELNDALDAWEEDYQSDTGVSFGPGGFRERGA